MSNGSCPLSVDTGEQVSGRDLEMRLSTEAASLGSYRFGGCHQQDRRLHCLLYMLYHGGAFVSMTSCTADWILLSGRSSG